MLVKRIGRIGWGVVASAIWVVSFCGFSLLLGEVGSSLLDMSPNEFGDWAAGLTAPLAFLWLVLGYLQQGEELRATVHALHLQEQALQHQVLELKQSVEQQAAVAEATRRQAELAERASAINLRTMLVGHQPQFIFDRAINNGSHRIQLDIRNIGAPCHDLEATVDDNGSVGGGIEVHPGAKNWGAGQSFWIQVTIRQDGAVSRSMILCYRDALMVGQTQRFRIEAPNWPDHNNLRFFLEEMSFNTPEFFVKRVEDILSVGVDD